MIPLIPISTIIQDKDHQFFGAMDPIGQDQLDIGCFGRPGDHHHIGRHPAAPVPGHYRFVETAEYGGRFQNRKVNGRDQGHQARFDVVRPENQGAFSAIAPFTVVTAASNWNSLSLNPSITWSYSTSSTTVSPLCSQVPMMSKVL